MAALSLSRESWETMIEILDKATGPCEGLFYPLVRMGKKYADIKFKDLLVAWVTGKTFS